MQLLIGADSRMNPWRRVSHFTLVRVLLTACVLSARSQVVAAVDSRSCALPKGATSEAQLPEQSAFLLLSEQQDLWGMPNWPSGRGERCDVWLGSLQKRQV
jgi:hypothetical protein